MSDDYGQKLAAWMARNGLSNVDTSNPDEVRMVAEDKASKEKDWCLGCDAHLPVAEMQIITRRTDRYMQTFEGEGYYIPASDRQRMCPECFKNQYEGGED